MFLADAYSIGPRPSGLGAPPAGAPGVGPGPSPGSAPSQAADAGQDVYVTGQHTCMAAHMLHNCSV